MVQIVRMDEGYPSVYPEVLDTHIVVEHLAKIPDAAIRILPSGDVEHVRIMGVDTESCHMFSDRVYQTAYLLYPPLAQRSRDERGRSPILGMDYFAGSGCQTSLEVRSLVFFYNVFHNTSSSARREKYHLNTIEADESRGTLVGGIATVRIMGRTDVESGMVDILRAVFSPERLEDGPKSFFDRIGVEHVRFLFRFAGSVSCIWSLVS